MKAHIKAPQLIDWESNYDECVRTFNKQWQSLSEKLLKSYIGVDDLDFLKQQDEFKWFFDMFNDKRCNYVSIGLSEVNNLYRFISEKNENKIIESRFIPDWKYASLNRMNDEGKLFQYLVTDYNNDSIENIIVTGEKELRATEFDTVYYSKFDIADNYKNLRIINLKCTFKDKQQLIKDFSYIKPRNKKQLEKFLIQVVIELLHKTDMFAPVDKTLGDDFLRKKYRPFHFISSYLDKMGYAGILYSSTVNPSGTNLVLFNIDYCKCDIDTITKI